jgi:hypothetical protein
MRFTEHELTVAVTGAAKTMVAARRKDVRKGRTDIDEVWDAMDRYERYQMLEAVGSQVLPVLVALPDVEVAAGTRPEFSTAQILNTVEEVVGDELGRMRRKVVVAARVALVRTALDHLPPRQDPDALIVPDHL